jgi:arylsulfatase A-like enzyme
MRFLKQMLLVIGAVCSTACVQAAETTRPNIVWIFSDDHSFQTIGAYGGIFKHLNPTPNIDRLARNGMRFDRCYVANSICGPSRATLLTGKFSHMNGKTDNVSTGFDHNQQQFQKILQTNGYQTVMIGKIHLNGKLQGFDYWEVLPGQGEYNDPDFITEDGQTKYKGYVTDIITDRALNWLENERDVSKPFMLMIHHKAAHRNWMPADRDMSRYEDVSIPEPESLFDDYVGRGAAAHRQEMSIADHMNLGYDLKVAPEYAVPGGPFAVRNEWYAEHNPKGEELVRWKYQQYMKDYLRCIWAMDENIGRVIKAIEAMGLADNTLIMYSSDQGFYNGEHGWFDKRFMYEESFRTPFVACWPGKIKAGSVNTDLVQNIDFAETFLDLAGVPVPDDMQGRSLSPLLTGQTPSDWRKSLYYEYYEYPKWHHVFPHEGVFDGRYKLIRFHGADVPGGEEWELYDLKSDPQEMQSVYNRPEMADIVQQMKDELVRLKMQYNVPADILPSVPQKVPGTATIR